MKADKATELLNLAREIVASSPDFHLKQGPGPGDRATSKFMQRLEKSVRRVFRQDEFFYEWEICAGASLRADFYSPRKRLSSKSPLVFPIQRASLKRISLRHLWPGSPVTKSAVCSSSRGCGKEVFATWQECHEAMGSRETWPGN